MNELSSTANRRILVVDDNEAIHQDFRKVLGSEGEGGAALAATEAALFGEAPAARQGFELDSAHQGEEALAMVMRALEENRPYALAFVDTRMPPGWDGVETIERLWQVDPQLQIALCTAYSDYSWEALSARLDLADRLLFLKKPFDNIEIRQMASALTMKWQMLQDMARKMNSLEEAVQESMRNLQKISHLAEHDVLTDLPNGVLLNHRLTQAIALSSRHQKHLAVVSVGIDGFQRINSALGGVIGNEILQSVAKRLVDNVRKSDPVFHRSGDQFVLVLEDVAHPDQTVSIAEKLLEAIRVPHHISGHEIKVTASIGISIYANDGDNPEVLIKKAETAMRNNHENRHGDAFRFFEHDMNVRTNERQHMAGNLLRALEQHEFVLYYQPKINLSSGKITGAEALIRWPIPGQGFVPPAQFIPLAEDCGLILPLGWWLLREACRQARSWQDSGLPALPIAVNVSALQFQSEHFLEGVREILAETSLEPHLLELEITEGILMEDIEATITVLKALKNLGVRVAIDDFGTGYSSLSYLKQFPVDTFKIDQSFVRDITTITDDATIVSAIVNLGKSLRLHVVAEGVETREQFTFLKAHGCEEGQGYYFSRAVSAKEFSSLVINGISHCSEIPLSRNSGHG